MAIKFLNSVAVDTDVLFVDTANERVGIGTASPSAKLDVLVGGTNHIQLGASALGSTGDYIGGLYYSSNKLLMESFLVGTGYQDILLSPNGGNVGIGTTIPTEKLTIAGNNKILFTGVSPQNLPASIGTDSNDHLAITAGIGSGKKITIGITGRLFEIQGSNNKYQNDNHIFSNYAGVESMRIISNGNVGIGTTSPAEKLDVNGNIKLNQYGQSIYFGSIVNEIKGSASDFLYKSFSKVQWDNAGTYTDSSYVFKQSGSEVFRIDTGGNVGIGTTSPYNKTHITTSVDGDGLLLDYSGGNDNKYVGVFFKIDNNTSDAYKKGALVWERTGGYNEGRFHFLLNNDDNASNVDLADSKVTILSTGDVGIGTTSPTSKLEVAGGDIELSDVAGGITMISPDGTRYRITVANGGTLTVTAV